MIIKTRKCSIKIILLSKPQLTFRLNNWSNSLELLFPGSWIQSRICVAFSYHVSLISFNLEQFFSFLSSFFECCRPIILYLASKCIFFFCYFQIVGSLCLCLIVSDSLWPHGQSFPLGVLWCQKIKKYKQMTRTSQKNKEASGPPKVKCAIICSSK